MAPALLACLAVTLAQPVPGALALVGEEDAPTTPAISLGAGLATTAAGVGMGLGFLQPYFRSNDPLALRTPPALAGLGVSLALFALGPNLGDALNGDWPRLVKRGGGRALLALGLGALAVFGGNVGALVGAFAGLAVTSWVAIDLYGSLDAPYRWAERENQARLAASGVALRF